MRWRVSKRGLIISGVQVDAVLLEHPRAAELPGLLSDDPGPDELARRLGDPNADRLVGDMTEAGILVDELAAGALDPAVPPPARVVLTRSGAEFTGIGRPARWIHHHLTPLWGSLAGRVALTVVVAAGVLSLVAGRPDGPTVSAHPWVDALLGVLVGIGLGALHELAHAVALVGYGRCPRRAGFGFYWGSVSFYVDSTEALTLPRRARVTQALVGLGVDVVTLSLLAVLAQVATPTLITAVAWRLALLGVLNLVINVLPILQVDGHWALADYLDEPELAVRARAALGATLRRGVTRQPRWLVVYGAISLLGGLVLLVSAGFIWWAAAGDLARALFNGNLADVLVGVALAAPIAASLLFSGLGLLLEVTLTETSL